jgi:hypothetical protein
MPGRKGFCNQLFLRAFRFYEQEIRAIGVTKFDKRILLVQKVSNYGKPEISRIRLDGDQSFPYFLLRSRHLLTLRPVQPSEDILSHRGEKIAGIIIIPVA